MKLYLNITEVRDYDHVQEFAELSATPVARTVKALDDKIITTYAIKWHSSACSQASVAAAHKGLNADLLWLYHGQCRLSGDLHALAFGA